MKHFATAIFFLSVTAAASASATDPENSDPGPSTDKPGHERGVTGDGRDGTGGVVPGRDGTGGRLNIDRENVERGGSDRKKAGDVSDSTGYTVTVTVTDIQGTGGQILVGLFGSSDGFPSAGDKAVRRIAVDVSGSTVRAVLKDIPPGTWAIGLLHDANGNFKMDRNWLGLPKEGFGASNDAKAIFGPPRFKDAKFKVDSDKFITISMKYL